MTHPDLTLAASIKRSRVAAGWSQRELARRAGVHQPQVARAERGEDLQVSLLARLCAPLGLAPALAPCASAPRAAPVAPVDRIVAAAGSDSVDANFESWRRAWPQVDPNVFAVLARLTLIGRHVEASIEETAALHGVSGAEVMVLGALRRCGAPHECTPTALTRMLWISLPGLKKRLDRLEGLGMVARSGNSEDLRGLVVRLTARGHGVLNDLVSHPRATVYQALLDTPSARLTELSGLLRALLSRLEDDAGGLPHQWGDLL